MSKISFVVFALLLSQQALSQQQAPNDAAIPSVPGTAGDLLNNADDLPDTVGDSIGDAAEGSGLSGIVGPGLADDIGGLIDSVVDVVDDIVESVTGVVRDIVDTLTGLLPGSEDSASGGVDLGCEALKDGGVLEPQSAEDGNPLLVGPGEPGGIDPNRCGS